MYSPNQTVISLSIWVLLTQAQIDESCFRVALFIQPWTNSNHVVYDICLTIADRKTIIDVEVDITLFRVGTGNTNTCTCTLNHGSITMDWQLPDIGKTITNTILPSSLSAYAVRIGRYSHSVDWQQSVISVHFRIMSSYSHGYALVCIQGRHVYRFL